MSFTSPLALLALLIVPLLAVMAFVVQRRRARYPVAFTNLAVLEKVSRRRRSARIWLPTAFLLLALACAATAVAGPRLNRTTADGHAVVVLLVDVSGSMQANDIAPSRIDAAVKAMQVFVEKLPKQADVGLVEFSTEPATIEMPTTNHNAVLDAIGLLSPEGATALGDGIGTAVQDVGTGLEQIHAARRAPGGFAPGAIVVLSDGAQNRGTLQPLQAAALAKAAGIRIYTVAYGTPGGKVRYEGFPTPVPVPPDPATMKAIARVTDGKTYSVRTAKEAVQIYGHLGSTIARTHKREQITSWLSLGAGVLLLAGVCLAVAGLSPSLP